MILGQLLLPVLHQLLLIVRDVRTLGLRLLLPLLLFLQALLLSVLICLRPVHILDDLLLRHR